MKITLPTDCGNAPRIDILGEFVTHWASGGIDRLRRWLADNATWSIAGRASSDGPVDLNAIVPGFAVEVLEVRSVITHGRLASCDGTLTAGDTRLDFSHTFRFASTAKSAKVAEVRSFCISSG